MTAHLKNCKSNWRLDVPVRSDLPVSSSSQATTDKPSTSQEAFPTTAEIKSRMKIWTANAAKKAVTDMDLTIGKMIFSANLPFSFSKNPFLEEIIDKIQIPNYKPPNPQKVGATILDDVYNSCVATNRSKFQGKKVVILQDGWSTNQNAPVICHTIHTGSESLMFHAVATKMNKKNSSYCFKLLEDAIALAEKTFKCEVVGVVTDNCSAMNNMRSLATEKIKGFHAYGCVAHLINLCGQELTDNQLMDDIVKVQKFFRNHHFESAALIDLKGTRPCIPGKTRWNSQLDTLESYQKNHLLYLQIARDVNSNVNKNDDLLEILNDGNKYNMVVRQLAVLKPVAVTLDKIQAEKCTLANAVDLWIQLLAKLPEDARRNQYVVEKSSMILTGVGLAAHMLHPIYRGRNLNREQEAVGFAEMTRLHFQLPVTATCLKALDDNIFPPHLLKEDAMKLMSPSAWWRGAGAYSNSMSSKLVEICDGLMMLPASTASLERAFSTMGNIITKKRNRLGIEKARKLAVIHKTLAFEMEPDEDPDED